MMCRHATCDSSSFNGSLVILANRLTAAEDFSDCYRVVSRNTVSLPKVEYFSNVLYTITLCNFVVPTRSVW